MSARSSKTMTTPDPSVAPIARVPSKVSGVSSASGPTNTPAAPPSRIARIDRLAGHAAAELDQLTKRRPERHLVDARASRRCPDRQNSFGPVEPSVPIAAKRAPPPGPSSRIASTLTSVSTLLTAVGLPNSPTSTGNGGLFRGSPRLPSIDSNSAVSSPQM